MLWKIKDKISYHVQEFLYDQFVDVPTEYVVSRGYKVHTGPLIELFYIMFYITL